MNDLGTTLRELLAEGSLELPLPGAGRTPERHRRLFEFARRDLSLARLVEAHTDAVAILAEADTRPRSQALYGVWASKAGRAHTEGEWHGGRLRLSGSKAFCSGAPLLDAALILVETANGEFLADVDLANRGIEIEAAGWAADAAMVRALTVRHLIERTCSEVLDRFGRCTGPHLLAFDGDVAQRAAELALYIRQCHAERDLKSLARRVFECASLAAGAHAASP